MTMHSHSPVSGSSSIKNGWRQRGFNLLYHHNTPTARTIDLSLVCLIIISVVVVILDSVQSIHRTWAVSFRLIEWGITIAFTIEYLMRLAVAPKPWRYAFSFWGIIDIAAVLPTYLSLFIPGAQSLLVVRALRVPRVLRILKMTRYVDESGVLLQALMRSRRKIALFLFMVLTFAIVAGTLLYVVEGPKYGFINIPTSMYWAVATMATVGFGDIVPHTMLGRLVTSALILIGYSIIAIPTGVYTAELTRGMHQTDTKHSVPDSRICQSCGHIGHPLDARYCSQCGHKLGETGN
ncbi:ion transporter [Pseudomonas sp. ZM23]|jgi:voltage-gated potassium channel|uniref:Ion transporter n=3 Tax=Pseudomonadota TaxID=1224 RepID=A0AAW7T1R2_BURVI|nr:MULTISPECIES: ion transporter [Pseudomonadota]MCP8465964.1 ion transporter [Pseudomonas triclosanedens]MCP8477263.1 ion transporter [Pseudomonas triclosanedens]MDN7796039.1 ion transporter [Burkholderia vietnamiensis]WAI47399.1 ion transporter [Pseudomonas triclosanedens]